MKSPLTHSAALALALVTLSAPLLRAEPMISEFMASNSSSLRDDDGTTSDWIEIYNPDQVPINLAGWFLTDAAKNKGKWAFPAIELPARGYLVVFASSKDRRDPARPLHTNFNLDAEGDYLGLIRPDGATVASEFAPAYPAQSPDISYGVAKNTAGYFHQPTPGAANPAPMLRETVSLSREAGPFMQPFLLTLSGAAADQRIRYVITEASALPRSEPSPVSTEYRGPIAINSSVVVCAAVFSANGAVSGPCTTAQFLKVNPNLASFSSQLPVLVIDNHGAGPLSKDGIDHPAWLHAYGARTASAPVFAAAPELATPASTTVRGASSAGFPKKGYNFVLRDSLDRKRAEPLLGLPDADKWALVAPWYFDHTYINNAFIYDLSNRLGRWAPRTRLAELFFNTDGGELDRTDYAGVYVLTERIERAENRLELAGLSAADTTAPAITGGYLLKIDSKEPDDFGWNSAQGVPATLPSSIILVSPQAEDTTAAQRDYIRDYVQRMENALEADRASGWAQRTSLDYIDRASWVDHHLLNTFACNPDAFIRSAYFTKDRGGKLVAGPVWDFDRALGSYWDERSTRWEVWSGVGGVDFWRTGWWGIIAQDPEFMQDWIERWQSLRRTELSHRSLIALVETLSARVGAEAAARDAARWPDNVSPYGSYAAQIERMKNWVTQRTQWIDEQFVAPPAVSNGVAGTITFVAPAGAQLAYTLDGSDPRSLGGEVAPNAQLTADPLTLAASSNVHVRAWRVELKNTFPGSPWSSAVGGERSSPLSPKARLVNLSSRALVGTGENALIAGVVVADTAAKRYLSRAVGPGLVTFGATGVVPDPKLSIYNGRGAEIFHNNGWQSGVDAAELPRYAKSVGAFPLAPGSIDSALASEVSAGAYTIQVTTPSGQAGIGLAELYELDANGRTVNLSTRARVRSGDGVLIGGFVVQGPAYKRMLLRAVGPTMARFGISNALVDPVLTVYAGQNAIATNDRWSEADNASAIARATEVVGAFTFAPGSEDAALLITLPPGAYTVELKGKAGAEGVALLEIYDVP